MPTLPARKGSKTAQCGLSLGQAQGDSSSTEDMKAITAALTSPVDESPVVSSMQ